MTEVRIIEMTARNIQEHKQDARVEMTVRTETAETRGGAGLTESEHRDLSALLLRIQERIRDEFLGNYCST